MAHYFISSKKQFFDLWASSYDWLFPSVFYQAIHKRLLSYVNLPPRSSVLDLGCGTGRLLNRLASQFPDMYATGLDLSPQMLRVARQNNHHHPRLIYIEGKAESLPFANCQFDAVFNTVSFLHYLQPEQVFAEVARVLKQNGYFYLVDSTFKTQTETYSIPITPGGVRFYNQKQREFLGDIAKLKCVNHHYLLGPVLLTIFAKQ